MLEPLGLRRCCVDLAQFGKEPRCFGLPTDRLVTAMNFQRSLREDGCEAIGFVERPTVNEAVVTGRTLQVDPEERLTHTLSELNLDGLSRTDLTAPSNSFTEASTLGSGRRDQFPRELIVGLVRHERLIKPLRDLLPPAGNEARPGVVVPQQIIPKRQPVLGVLDVARQQLTHQPRSFVSRLVRQKLV